MVHTVPASSYFNVDRAVERAHVRGADLPRIVWPAESGSTNDELAAALQADPSAWPDYSVWGTDHQISGHARLDRVWTVPARKALTVSVPVRIPADLPMTALGWLPLITGAAVAGAIGAAGVDAGVKWPNDVLVAGKKICGILIRMEQVADERVAIIGIGINVSLEAAELPVPTATSLALAGGSTDREQLLADVLGGLRSGLGELFGHATELSERRLGVSDLAVGRRVRDTMLTLGRGVRVELPGGRSLTGRATGLGAGGDLVVETPEGTGEVSAGDVIHVRADAKGGLL